MPDLPFPDLSFPDLATPAARETQPPPFEEIVGRAKRRRRRGALGAAAGTAAVVAVVVAGVSLVTGDQDAEPRPAKPTVSHRSGTATPAAVDPGTVVRTGGLLSYAAGPDGSLLTVWKACPTEDESACDLAWQLEAGGDIHRGLLSGDLSSASAGAAGFVVASWRHRGVVIDLHGRSRPIVPAASGKVRPGDVFIRDGKDLVLVDPRTATSWALPTEPDRGAWVQASVADDGSIWAMTTRGHDLPMLWSKEPSAQSPWRQHLMQSSDPHDALPGYLATSGRHVAALTGYDGATVLPVADLAVTSDGGQTWVDLHQSDLPFQYVDSMAATSGGTLYVVTPAGEHLYRSTDDSWTRFAEVPNPAAVGTLVPAGDHVLARGGSFEAPTLVALDDAGQATPVPLAR
ncbi:hypothetical protein [Nocardioides pocheonensis]|uniref:Exo-alpha-sialidase n=1 Tax=Nocardioides pocheonensis TaxID=661485 RepID=A0A3N0GXH2_9ACTN|nr:hypothetical protein [Nocardioides pocheonensis]RNM17184.1 hypothetical protein EFL26_02145 [Nocardioides pocheonensis]